MMNEDLMRMHGPGEDRDFRRAALWSWIEPRLVPGRAIDVGGGAGYMTRRLVASGFPTVLAEPDAALYEFSELSLPPGADLRVVQESAEELDPGELGQFENVVCLDVLEHIERDTAALVNIARILAPPGRMIISVPAVPALFGKRDVAYGHYRRYSADSLSRLIRDAGLTMVEMTHWNALGLAPYFFFERVLRRPINDSLRQNAGGALQSMTRRALIRWLTWEGRIKLPVGLSLLAVVRLPSDPS
jgi:SAM-dependent methyltransferase